MAPEVLIVGDATRRTDLLERVEGLGYEATMCSRAVLEQRVTQGTMPGAVLVCTEDVDPRALMATLRGTRRGSGVPVTLYGPLGGSIGDLADVLDLGADHFLEAPAADEALAAALEELLGPGVAPPSDALDSLGWHAADGSATTGSAVAGSSAGRSGSSRGRGGATDVVLGQLHRTLDMLEARLRERDGEGDGADDLDLDALGLPAVDDEGVGSSAASGSSLELPLAHTEAALRADRADQARAGRARRERTERLQDAHGPRGEGSGSVGTGSRSGVAPAREPSLGEDGLRRSAPLPIENRGALDRTEVPRLLWTLHRARYTGALVLEHGRVEKRLWWRDGEIVLVRSTVGHDRLVDGLLRRGLLTRDQYETAQQLTAGDPRLAGQRLVEAGFLKATELPRVLGDHLLRIIDSTFPWTEGRWVLSPGERSEEQGVVDTPVPLVVAEGVRHRMERARLLALVGDLEAYPRVRAEAVGLGGLRALAERLRMSPSEEAWLARLDGSATLRALLARPGADELELLGLVYTLHVLERVELRGDGLEHRGAGLVAAPHAVDLVAIDVARIRDRLQLVREGDYFAALGLSRDAERLDVRRAHAQLHRTFDDAHLERSVGHELRAELEELRDLLDEARDVLADDGLRSAYLAHLEEDP